MTVKGRNMWSMSEPATRTETVPEWTLGWKLKRALDFANVSAQDMAAELGVHVATVSRWMNDRETPRRAYVMAWALRCGVPLAWLTGPETTSGGYVELPRLDSNQQPFGWRAEPNGPAATAELTTASRSIDELRRAIRRGPIADTDTFLDRRAS